MRGRLALLARSIRWLLPLAFRGPGSHYTTADLIERRAAAQPGDVFVRFEGRELCYGAFNAAANQVAHWALARGLCKGDVVALLMQNRPEYLVLWAGLAKVGATTALLNTQLTGRALAHALGEARARLVVLGAECLASWSSLADTTPTDVELLVAADPFGAATPALPPGARRLEDETVHQPDSNPPRRIRAALRGGDPLFFIYTSGTTGLPKAARFSHARFLGGGTYALLAGFGKTDSFFCPLPLYHTVGGVMCVNAVLRSGGSLALARRFSARRFWDDVVEMGATAFQYVGELPRYLLDQPEHPLEQRHRIRFCVGNGMRPEVWERFRDRFRIPQIVELYGATESNVSMVNLDNRVGSVGKPPFGLRVALVRYDIESQELVRDAAGRLVACLAGEAGELIGRISEGRTVAGRFEGYTSGAATESKILRDAFTRGDAWFRSGDLMRRDADGYFFFVDRIGDTFRWKGENVSTQEVADAIGELAGVELCAVYGVQLPGADGRAGMAALVLRDGRALDGCALYAHVAQHLPGYARPAFVRVIVAADLTGTFKLRKGPLQREGFEPTASDDPVLFRDDTQKTYLPLTQAIRERIRSGNVRF